LQVSLIERRKSGIELTEQGEEIVRRGRTTLPQCAMCSITPRACAAGSAQARGHSVNRALSLVGGTARAATALPESHFAPPRDDHRDACSGAGQRRSRPGSRCASHRGSRDRDAVSLRRQVRPCGVRPTCLRMSGCCCSRRAIACDQALSFCRLVTPAARESFGASSLATIVQSVAHGYGIILLPEIRRSDIRHAAFPCAGAKTRDRARLATSPRKADFQALRGCSRT
jgi:DNA-binding transcriptional LysR family regulator